MSAVLKVIPESVVYAAIPAHEVMLDLPASGVPEAQSVPKETPVTEAPVVPKAPSVTRVMWAPRAIRATEDHKAKSAPRVIPVPTAKRDCAARKAIKARPVTKVCRE